MKRKKIMKKKRAPSIIIVLIVLIVQHWMVKPRFPMSRVIFLLARK
ncbi:MAG: hypothetical protein AMDU4_FER2C00144G0002 [Ferroplasma sp. Type II]|nr:MAG: hypothetical protein AMDU4_FER2C00144G0002 [Ferroplasma sp. Type II]